MEAAFSFGEVSRILYKDWIAAGVAKQTMRYTAKGHYGCATALPAACHPRKPVSSSTTW